MQLFRDTLEKFNAAADEAEVVQVFESAARSLGLNQYMAGIFSDNANSAQEGEVLGVNYGEDWLKAYGEGLIQNDIYLHEAAVNPHPFVWQDIAPTTGEQKEFIGLSADAGLAHGFSASVFLGSGKVGAVSLASDVDCDIHQHLPEIYALSCAFHSTIEAMRRERMEKRARLTAREREVLLWLARGKTYWEIGQILTIAENTVRNHAASCYRKLDAHDATLACLKAVMAGLINP